MVRPLVLLTPWQLNWLVFFCWFWIIQNYVTLTLKCIFSPGLLAPICCLQPTTRLRLWSMSPSLSLSLIVRPVQIYSLVSSMTHGNSHCNKSETKNLYWFHHFSFDNLVFFWLEWCCVKLHSNAVKTMFMPWKSWCKTYLGTCSLAWLIYF